MDYYANIEKPTKKINKPKSDLKFEVQGNNSTKNKKTKKNRKIVNGPKQKQLISGFSKT